MDFSPCLLQASSVIFASQYLLFYISVNITKKSNKQFNDKTLFQLQSYSFLAEYKMLKTIFAMNE